jgi:hypothetical protein
MSEKFDLKPGKPPLNHYPLQQLSRAVDILCSETPMVSPRQQLIDACTCHILFIKAEDLPESIRDNFNDLIGLWGNMITLNRQRGTIEAAITGLSDEAVQRWSRCIKEWLQAVKKQHDEYYL